MSSPRAYADIGVVVILERAKRRQRLNVGLQREMPVEILTDLDGAITSVSLNGERLSFAITALPAAPAPVPEPAWRSRLRACWRTLRQQARFLSTVWS